MLKQFFENFKSFLYQLEKKTLLQEEQWLSIGLVKNLIKRWELEGEVYPIKNNVLVKDTNGQSINFTVLIAPRKPEANE